MQIQNTVFISYRRSNIPIAQAVRLSLIAHGFDVFLDYESINSGSFAEAILAQIAARAHFIVLLTPSALENCLSPDDWVRREIEEAIKLKRNIVPLLFDGFEFKLMARFLQGNYLPLLTAYNGMTVHWDMFDSSMEKLRTRYLNIPLDWVKHPLPTLSTGLSNAAPSPEAFKAQEYFERGIRKHQQGQFEEAIKEFDRALLLHEDFAEAYFKRGHSYFNQGQKVKALENWEKAVEIDPKHPKLNLMMAYIYAERGRYREALAEANLALKAYPDSEEAYGVRAWVLLDVQNYQAVLQDANTLIALNPQNLANYNIRGLAYIGLKDYYAALADFEQAIAISPNSAASYNNRGIAHEDLKDYAKALSDYQKAATLNPDERRYQDNIQRVEKLKS